MKLKYKMEIVDIDGSPTAVPAGGGDEFRGVLRMNDTAAAILKLLADETTEEKIVSALKAEYEVSEEQLRASVAKILNSLREHQLLEE